MTQQELKDLLTRIKSLREGKNKHDTIHLLVPFKIDKYEFSLPSDAPNNIFELISYLFSTMYKDANFDLNHFIRLREDVIYKKNDKRIKLDYEYYILDFLVSIVMGSNILLKNNNKGIKSDSFGLNASILTIGRLTATFQSISILIKSGFYMEVKYLFRVTLEQIAYSYKCIKIKNKSELSKIEASKCISSLKELRESVGRLNGFLSNYIHHNKKTWGDFTDISNEVGIKTRSGEMSKVNILIMVSLVKIYLSVIIEIDKELEENSDPLFLDAMYYHLEIIETMENYFHQKYE